MKSMQKAPFPGWDQLLESDVFVPEICSFLKETPNARYMPGAWVLVSRLLRRGDIRRAKQELTALLDGPLTDQECAELYQSLSRFI